MKKKQLLPISMKVIFLDTWSKEAPKIGWILSNNESKLEQHPYVVSITKLNDQQKETIVRDSTIDDKETFYIHKDLVIPFTEKHYSILIRNNRKIHTRSKKINSYAYNYYCLSNKIVSFSKYRFHRIIKRIADIFNIIWSFCYNVIVIGTIYLFLGNIIKLYSNQYKKYEIRKQINKKIDQMHPDSFYFNGDGPITDDDEVISILYTRLDQANKEVETSSLNLVTLLIAIVSIIVSIL